VTYVRSRVFLGSEQLISEGLSKVRKMVK
jgi:hypothetical protein